MSETEQNKTTDDNIITRRKHVKEALNVIRDKKERLHAAMKTISTSDEPDKAMMAKLLGAYDMMTAQENQYIAILKNIVEIHELAVNDVAKEIEEKKKSLPVPEEAKEETTKKEEDTKKEETKNKEETANKEEKITKKIEESAEKAEEVAENVDDTEGTVSLPAENDEDMLELQATLKELQEVSLAAAAASKVHEQLIEKLQLQKNKKATLNEIRKEKTSSQRKEVNDVLTEFEIAKLKVNTEKTAKGRKEKQLERLRKEALKRGIQMGEEEQKEKEAMIAAAKESDDRIPPVQTEEEKEEQPDEPEKTEEEKLEERRKQIRENVKKEREKKELINQQIRERLKAMEARKERIRQLRLALQRSGEPPETESEARQAVEDMFTNAAANLANLTAMRERLEAMQVHEIAATEEEEGEEEKIEENQSPTDEASAE